MHKVMVFGTFDVLHKGHIFLFEQAKLYGDFLVVVVARDKTVRRVKGHRTTFSEGQRLKAVQSVHIVNYAVLGDLHDVYKVLEDFSPDTICLGYDQQAFTHELEEELKKRDVPARIIRLPPYKEQVFKSSLIKQQKKGIKPIFV